MESLAVFITFGFLLVFSELCFDTIERLCSVATINYRIKKGGNSIGIQSKPRKSFFK